MHFDTPFVVLIPAPMESGTGFGGLFISCDDRLLL
jgi:hypothetical protein